MIIINNMDNNNSTKKPNRWNHPYTIYSEKEWDEIRDYYKNNPVTRKDVMLKYNIPMSWCDKHLKGIKPHQGIENSKRRTKVIAGQKYNRLTIIREISKFIGNKNRRYVESICDCGNTFEVSIYNIKNGIVKSCGCIVNKIDIIDGQKVKIKTLRQKHKGVYTSWGAMKGRCLNPNSLHYKHYGGRGITVCERWMKFENFLADMGDRPEGQSLDRIDVNGNYEPGNCKWSTWEEQRANQRPIEFKFISYDELKEIVKDKGIKSAKEWFKWVYSIDDGVGDYNVCINNIRIPINPQTVYRGNGWINWHQFLGKK
jgi:hypothetical protein